jgi:hypothetical protein
MSAVIVFIGLVAIVVSVATARAGDSCGETARDIEPVKMVG